MNNYMNKSMKIWLVFIILIVTALLAAFWAASTFYPPQFPWRQWPHPEYIPGDIEFFYIAKTVVSTINLTLLIFLLLTYIDMYRKTRSEFTIGLMIFSMIFLLNAFTSNPLVMWAFGFRAFGLGPFALLPDLFEFVALTVLLYLSVKY
jgi:hypothetical protein